MSEINEGFFVEIIEWNKRTEFRNHDGFFPRLFLSSHHIDRPVKEG